MTDTAIQLGRPRATVNFALILRYRTVDNLGWLRVAQRYREKTGQFIGKDTCRRRYEEYLKENGDKLPTTLRSGY